MVKNLYIINLQSYSKSGDKLWVGWFSEIKSDKLVNSGGKRSTSNHKYPSLEILRINSFKSKSNQSCK